MQPPWQSSASVKADPEHAEPEQEPAPQSGDPAAAEPERRTLHRWQKALIAVVGSVALFAVLLRVSYDFALDSDSANNALQAWGMLHGNVLLHGWIVGDATYFAFELPLFVIAETIFGLGSIDTHAVAAAAYALVILSTAAVARTGTRGMAAAARTAIVLAIMSVPLLLPHVVGVLLEKPDHTGTTAITMVCFLLADR